jgi:CheY-specific phosphatase CheX
MDLQTRKELLAVSTSGKNAAAKGFMGKIRDMISTVTLPDDPETKAMTDQALGLMALGCQAGSYAGSYSWSMSTYVASIEKAETIQVEAAKDELEKSIVANLADDVTVHIVNSDVEIAIYKSF